jgi:hypothetical protein
MEIGITRRYTRASMPDPATSPKADQSLPSGSELQKELLESNEEILRLRDLLIARDIELGAARGRLAELEAHSMQLINAVARLRALIPGFIRVLIRKLRG